MGAGLAYVVRNLVKVLGQVLRGGQQLHGRENNKPVIAGQIKLLTGSLVVGKSSAQRSRIQ